MCTTCGCGDGETRIEGDALHDHEHEHWHQHADGSWHSHDHAHDHQGEHGHGTAHEHAHSHGHAYKPHTHRHTHGDGSEHAHPHDHAHDHGHGSAHEHSHEHEHSHDHGHAQHSHAPGVSAKRTVQIEQDILAKNNAYAAVNRARLAERAILALNLVSSPGSGKTSLLTRTLTELQGKAPLAVIEGDQETALDAERIRATGAPAIQINTGKGCHLDAHMVGHALEKLPLPDGGYLFIENVGNLVCPAAFDLGEAAKVAILSTTEGADKPLKYPDMFHAASLMVINKIDLLPYVDFDVQQAIDYARRVNPQLEVLTLSVRSGEGFDAWLTWLAARLDGVKGARVAALEAELAKLKK